MSQRPHVTVIVPCYNHEKFITQCVESIVHQTYPHIHLVVFDDGSTDNSLNILKELQAKYGFELYEQKNKGLVRTLNHALATVNLGEYVCLTASDDYWPLDKIERQVNFMERNIGCQLCYGNYTEVNENGDTLEIVRCRAPGKNIFSELLISNFITATTVMLRASVLKVVGHFDEHYKIEDWYMWLKIYKKFPVDGFLNVNLAYYRLHAKNSHKNIKFIDEESIKLLSLYKDDPSYPLAVSILTCKKIFKTMMVSFYSGLKCLVAEFNIRMIWSLLYCLILGKGPFRKIKFGYLNFKRTSS